MLAYTLLSDGSSDAMLLPVLDWLLVENARLPFSGQWADLRGLPRPPRDLRSRISRAMELHPCELLFVHRDAETAPRDARVEEIKRAVTPGFEGPLIPVIPVRMQEAWFLFDEAAIREAIGNPSGTSELRLPDLKRVESTPDPKAILDAALLDASDLNERRRSRLKVGVAKRRLSTLINDFSPLRALGAFKTLEEELRTVLEQQGWGTVP